MSHVLNLEDHKSIQDGAVKQTYLCFNETFVKRRKLQVDLFSERKCLICGGAV